VVIDEMPVDWPSGQYFGKILLYYSPACQAVWGYLVAPNSTAWTIHIIPVRPADHLTIPWQFSGNTTLPGSWSNVLTTRRGCVYVESFVSSKAAGNGPVAKTACFSATSPEVRQTG
jgi:hypothetical protein